MLDLIIYAPAVNLAWTLLKDVCNGAKRFLTWWRVRPYRRWTKEQEAHLRAGGVRFKLQVVRKDKDALLWAVAQRRLRVTRDTQWGWYVVLETRLASDAEGGP